MKLFVAFSFFAVLTLCGCRPAASADAEGAAPAGRYLGIGIYGPNTQWTKMVGADDPKAPASGAQTIDDQAIIVVQDSRTGEIRACGDMTGYCIGVNPWKKPLAPSQMVPINLSEHVKLPPQPAAASAATQSSR